MKRKKLLAVIMLALSAAVCGGMDASAVWQMDEVNVVGERYDADNAQSAPIASGLIGTKQEVGALGKKDVLDVPFQQMTFTKQAIETFSQPERSLMDTLSLSPSVTSHTRVSGYQYKNPRLFCRRRQLDHKRRAQHEPPDDHAYQLF